MHELTEKIIKFVGAYQQEQLDSIIRSYLSEKAKEFNHEYCSTPQGEVINRKILGLESEPETVVWHDKNRCVCEKCHPKPKEDDVKMVRSESIELVLYRWRDGYYSKDTTHNDNHAVSAMRELFQQDALTHREKGERG